MSNNPRCPLQPPGCHPNTPETLLTAQGAEAARHTARGSRAQRGQREPEGHIANPQSNPRRTHLPPRRSPQKSTFQEVLPRTGCSPGPGATTGSFLLTLRLLFVAQTVGSASCTAEPLRPGACEGDPKGAGPVGAEQRAETPRPPAPGLQSRGKGDLRTGQAPAMTATHHPGRRLQAACPGPLTSPLCASVSPPLNAEINSSGHMGLK